MKKLILVLASIPAVFGIFGSVSNNESSEAQNSPSKVTDLQESSDIATEKLIQNMDIDRFQGEHTLLVATNHMT